MDGKVKVKLRKTVTAQCGKMQAVTTLCRLQCGVAKLCVIVPCPVALVPSPVALVGCLSSCLS